MTPLFRCVRHAILLTSFALPAAAQSGSLDQVGLFDHSLNPGFARGQQQVRAGRAGLLEGIEVGIDTAPAGSTFEASIRLGPGWNTTPAVWTGIGTTTNGSGSNEVVYLDTSSAGIQLAQDDLFVIEIRVLTNPGGIQFNFLVQRPGADRYPEPFFLSGNLFPGSDYRSLCFRTWIADGLGSRYCATAPNSVGIHGAVLSVHGSTSVSAADLELVAARTPTNFGIFFYGSNQVQVPIGDGNLCVSGQLSRLPIVLGDDYLMRYEVDYGLPAASSLVPGSTWSFQMWYRDPGAQGAGFNFSDAVELSFTP